jgi:hypothetical protein
MGHRLCDTFALGLVLPAIRPLAVCRVRGLPPLRAGSPALFEAAVAISLDREGWPGRGEPGPLAGPVLMGPAESGLFPGRYAFEVVPGEGRSRWRAERSFEVEEGGPPGGARSPSACSKYSRTP